MSSFLLNLHIFPWLAWGRDLTFSPLTPLGSDKAGTHIDRKSKNAHGCRGREIFPHTLLFHCFRGPKGKERYFISVAEGH